MDRAASRGVPLDVHPPPLSQPPPPGPQADPEAALCRGEDDSEECGVKSRRDRIKPSLLRIKSEEVKEGRAHHFLCLDSELPPPSSSLTSEDKHASNEHEDSS